jgi:hypothetical protein
MSWRQITATAGFSGYETPQSGGESIVRAITAEKGKGVNTGEFRGQHGEVVPW